MSRGKKNQIERSPEERRRAQERGVKAGGEEKESRIEEKPGK